MAVHVAHGIAPTVREHRVVTIRQRFREGINVILGILGRQAGQRHHRDPSRAFRFAALAADDPRKSDPLLRRRHLALSLFDDFFRGSGAAAASEGRIAGQQTLKGNLVARRPIGIAAGRNFHIRR
jgi:hypothetical protein